MKTNAILGITYILSGSLFEIIGAVGDSWGFSFISLFGFMLYLMGLNKLSSELDSAGQRAAGLLKTAAYIGLGAAFLAFIPVIGYAALFFFSISYLLRVYGYYKIKSSTSIGSSGKTGSTLLIVATVLANFVILVDFIPIIGGFVSSALLIVVLSFLFFGWVRIQNGLIETTA